MRPCRPTQGNIRSLLIPANARAYARMSLYVPVGCRIGFRASLNFAFEADYSFSKLEQRLRVSLNACNDF